MHQGIPDTPTSNLRIGYGAWRLPVSSRRADHAVAGMLIFGRAADGPMANAPSAKGNESAADRSLQRGKVPDTMCVSLGT
jgi:hypothetical protein